MESITYKYNRGRLASVRDDNRPNLGFDFYYSGEMNQLESVRLVSPLLSKSIKLVSFTYDYDDLITASYNDGSSKTYTYDDSYYKLNGIIDENNVLASSWTYKDKKAISSSKANGINKTDISYSKDGFNVSVKDALGYITQYKITEQKGAGKIYSLSTPCISEPCDYTQKYLTFTDEGNVSTSTNAKSVVTSYKYNERDLEKSIIIAEGSTEEKRFDIEWHSHFNLPIRYSDPNQSISYEYDAHGNLIRRAIKSAQRELVTIYSYNDYGLLLRKVTPKTGETLYTYDDNGNLIAEKNAADQITRYEDYTVFGLPQKITQPNGIVISKAYDRRGRLVSQSEGDLVTQYEYDAVGNLLSVIEPSGMKVNYTYNDAYQLVGISNSAGASVTFTLDKKGNVTQKVTVDASNSLTQYIKK